MTIEEAKKAAGYHAASLIENGMIVGLGTGTTATYFIEKLIERCRQGLKIQAVSSSLKSQKLAMEGKIPFIDINQITSIDLAVDGADEIDLKKRMIKGAGGALVREKIVAEMSEEMIVVIDESKRVQHLGKCPLAVEIIPFGHLATEAHLEKLGYEGMWRKTPEGALFLTDNQNYLLDLVFDQPLANPEIDHELIIQIPGVVDTGFFFNLAGRVITGHIDGKITIT